MTSTLVVTAEAQNRPPRFRLDFTYGGAGTGESVTILRTASDGSLGAVRTAAPATLVAGLWTGYDYEAPYALPVSYTAAPTATVAADPVTAPAAPLWEYGAQTAWLVHPGIPSLSVPVVIASRGDRTRVSKRAMLDVLGREDPMVKSDGTRRAPAYDMVLRSASTGDEDALLNLLGDDSVLLLQEVYPPGSGIARARCEWVSVGDVTEAQLVQWAGNTIEHWTLPCQVTSAPAGLLQAQWSYADVLAGFGTYADVLAAFATYQDLLTDTPV